MGDMADWVNDDSDGDVDDGSGAGDLERCVWREDEYGDWDTDCGERYQFTGEGPRENKLMFCGYCGRPILEERIDLEASNAD